MSLSNPRVLCILLPRQNNHQSINFLVLYHTLLRNKMSSLTCRSIEEEISISLPWHFGREGNINGRIQSPCQLDTVNFDPFT